MLGRPTSLICLSSCPTAFSTAAAKQRPKLLSLRWHFVKLEADNHFFQDESVYSGIIIFFRTSRDLRNLAQFAAATAQMKKNAVEAFMSRWKVIRLPFCFFLYSCE
jgi:hypothetical protein